MLTKFLKNPYYLLTSARTNNIGLALIFFILLMWNPLQLSPSVLWLGLLTPVLLVISNMNPLVIAVLGVQGLSAQMLGHVNFDLHVPFLSKV